MEKKIEIKAIKNAKGFVVLSLDIGDMHNIPIQVNDFGGKDKKKAKKLTYKIYCLVNEVK